MVEYFEAPAMFVFIFWFLSTPYPSPNFCVSTLGTTMCFDPFGVVPTGAKWRDMDMLFPISNKYFGWLGVTWVEEKGFRRVTQKMNEKFCCGALLVAG